MTTEMHCAGCDHPMSITVSGDGPMTVVSVLCDRCTRRQDVREASVEAIRASLDVFRVDPVPDEVAALEAYRRQEINLEELAAHLHLPLLVLPVPYLKDIR